MNRAHTLRLFAAAVVAPAAIYACTGDDTTAGPTTLPPNDASVMDTSTTTDATPTADVQSDAPVPAKACSTLPGTIVYIESGDTQEPLLKTLGRELRDTANITLVFELTGSCTLTPNLYDGVPIPKSTNMLYIPSTAENATWDPSQPEETCATDPVNGTPPDLGISALFPASCRLGGPEGGSGIGLINGPIQAYTFIVPTTDFMNDQQAIWAEEAYYAFGFGATNPVMEATSPLWNDPTQMFIRPTTKSTLVATAFNIDVPAADWMGTSESTSTEVLTAVEAATSAKAIGILGDEVYDANRGHGANVLAYRAFGQTHAYFPDSTVSAFDKQNIRDGHYTLWSPTVYITSVDGSNVPTNPAVKYLTDLVLGNQAATPPDGGTAIDGLAAVVGVGLTPDCAMQVTRSGDGQPLSLYTPAQPCTCYFLSKISGATGTPANCTTCSTSSPCATGTCLRGFCEPGGAVPYTGDAGACVSNPSASADIPNGCTDATAIDKTGITLPAADGGLEPLP
jgi:hypothetical protein